MRAVFEGKAMQKTGDEFWEFIDHTAIGNKCGQLSSLSLRDNAMPQCRVLGRGCGYGGMGDERASEWVGWNGARWDGEE